MALVVPDVGEVAMLNMIVNKVAPTDVKLHLYDELTTIDEDTVLATLALVEVDRAGYTATGYTLANASWTVATATGTSSATHTQVEVALDAAGGASNVYGYYVTDSTSAILLWAEEFTDGPYVIPLGGGSVFVTPKIELA